MSIHYIIRKKIKEKKRYFDEVYFQAFQFNGIKMRNWKSKMAGNVGSIPRWWRGVRSV